MEYPNEWTQGMNGLWLQRPDTRTCTYRIKPYFAGDNFADFGGPIHEIAGFPTDAIQLLDVTITLSMGGGAQPALKTLNAGLRDTNLYADVLLTSWNLHRHPYERGRITLHAADIDASFVPTAGHWFLAHISGELMGGAYDDAVLEVTMRYAMAD